MIYSRRYSTIWLGRTLELTFGSKLVQAEMNLRSPPKKKLGHS